jgi:hypothetical protein
MILPSSEDLHRSLCAIALRPPNGIQVIWREGIRSKSVVQYRTL